MKFASFSSDDPRLKGLAVPSGDKEAFNSRSCTGLLAQANVAPPTKLFIINLISKHDVTID